MTRCPTCDRPLATPDLEAHADSCECAACVAHCWSEYGADCKPVDWRERALKAEADAKDALAEARYRDGVWNACCVDVCAEYGEAHPGCTVSAAIAKLAAAEREIADVRSVLGGTTGPLGPLVQSLLDSSNRGSDYVNTLVRILDDVGSLPSTDLESDAYEVWHETRLRLAAAERVVALAREYRHQMLGADAVFAAYDAANAGKEPGR